MPIRYTRLTALTYLAALALTSMPVYVGLLGWCPCGCIPEALVASNQNNDDPSQAPAEREHHHDSHHCKGCQALSYCPLIGEPMQTLWADAGPLVVECSDLLPPGHVVRQIRPPRA
jgi:hypothetical protein